LSTGWLKPGAAAIGGSALAIYIILWRVSVRGDRQSKGVLAQSLSAMWRDNV
jgi:hypothetical protein